MDDKRLRLLIHYDPETGIFRRVSERLNCLEEPPVGILNQGYLVATVDGEQWLLHRLAWLYVYGELPKYSIDHINGIGSDNRIENLREATQSENLQNQKKAQRNSLSGLLGASPKGNRYRAQIWLKGRLTYLGTFSTPEEAHEAYLTAKRELHPFCTI